MPETKDFLKLTVNALEDRKGVNIRVIDISKVSTIADYFVIASGTNRTQVQALADSVDETLGKAGLPAKSIEGYSGARWILMDFGDIVVHIFDKDSRDFYDLERIWRDGKNIDPDSL
ncbi:MAG: ribosome silencing factor [Eubacteriales bacterium]|jgi:ribosome-associated protein